MAIIINYAGGYSKLFTNAIAALEAAQEGLKSSLFAFHKYSILRQQFFTDYSYVLCLTGPYRPGGMFLEIPEGFESGVNAVRLLS